jgi:GNAT superfamily N-acetyltransferase
MVNRAVGLGVDVEATESDVEAVLRAMPAETSFYVAVAASAKPAELPRWLEERGLEPGWGWMTFKRGVDVPERRPTRLRIVPVEGDAHAAAFARVVRTGYGLPESLEPVLEHVPRTGWRCYLALDGEEPASAAGLFVSERAGYLGFAATLPEHRGKGGQNALLAERIEEAARLSCDIVLTETGERRDDRPSSSYRNILRAGFEEVAVTANWLGRS